MNLCRLHGLASAATLFLACGVAAGKPLASESAAIGREILGPALAPPDRRPRPLTPQEQAVLERFDTNHDGKLEPQELDAAHGEVQQARRGREAFARRVYTNLLARFDLQHEGRLSPEEEAQAVEFLRTTRPKIYDAFVRQFDRNGDGKLDPAELSSMFEILSKLPPPS